MTKTIILILVTICSFAFGQTGSDFLLGDWIEIRREERSGSVYTIGGQLNEPSIEFSFDKNGTCTFYNPHTPDPKSTHPYLLLGDTLLGWKGQIRMRIADVVKIDKDDLIIVIRSTNGRKADHDLKCYFIRQEAFSKLTTEEKEKLKAPTDKDKIYLEKIKAKQAARKKKG
jgi:hypothetical protein